MKKPKVGIFDFACCEGCQLQIANMGEDVLDVLGAVEVLEWREVMSEKWGKKIDIAIVEGSITDSHAAARVRRIRKKAKVLMTIGSCATIGGVNGMKNNFALEDIRKYVYGSSYRFFPTELTRAVHQVVTVDYFVHGCPMYIPEFVAAVKAALQGIPYYPPDYPICVECKLNENVCMYDRGVGCLGPVTRAGCNSWCINNGNICYGCRGMVSNPNERGARDVLARYKIPMELVLNKMNMYNKCRELD